MQKIDFNIGQQFYCPSDNRTREIIDIDSSKVILQCLDCTAALKPLSIPITELIKKIQWKTFVLREERLEDKNGRIKKKEVITEKEVVKESIKESHPVNIEVVPKEQPIKVVPIPAKPSPPNKPKQDQQSLF